MKTVLEWILSKDAVKVEFDNYLDSDMDQILEIHMNTYSGSTTLSKYQDAYMQHPITLNRRVHNSIFMSNDGSIREDKIIEILDEMYETCRDILGRLRN